MTATLWPWLAVAGLGALHGLNPATGWMFAAALGVQARDGTRVRHALLPIAIGHAASIAVVAGVFTLGLALDRAVLQGGAGALLLAAAFYRKLRGAARPAPMPVPASHAGIALWSFLMASAHGAGMMLVPALVPLCMADNPAREITASGFLLLALAAVTVHTTAMLVTIGLVATGVCRGVVGHPRLLSGAALGRGWTVALAVTGVVLIALR